MTPSRPCPACGDERARPAGEKNSFALVRCRACSTLHTAALPAAQWMHAFYDGYYVDDTGTPESVRIRLDDIVRGFHSYRRTGRLLDVGFGGGALLHAARRAGWEVSGTEVSATAVARAAGEGFDVSAGNLEEVRYPDGVFDVVAAVELLEHLVDPLALVVEIRRVLRPGGLLWATTPHGRGISARLLGAGWSAVAPPEHIQLFTARGVRQMLWRAGYRDVRLAMHGANPLELLSHFRRPESGGAGPVQSACAVNEFCSSTSSRRMVKRAGNSVLSMLGLGDSLKVYATA